MSWRPSQIRGIGTRLALLAAGAVLLTMALGGGAMIRAMSHTYREDARMRAASLLGTLAVPCAMSLAVHALERLDGYLTEVTRVGGDHMGVMQVAMLDVTGHVIARSAGGVEAPTQRRDNLDADFVKQAALADDALWREVHDGLGRPVLLVSMPAVSGLRWGTLVAAFDLRPVEVRTAWARRALAGFSLALAAVLALVLYLGLSAMVVRPVRVLADAAAAIQRGNLGARARLNRADELGRLSLVFDRMADEVESATQALEAKVAERSAEVVRKNEQLEELNHQLQRAVSELARLARTDALTNVHNRRHFAEVIEHEVARQATTVTTLLMVDVDHFKRVNDAFGHPIGDVVLREIAMILSRGLRGADVLTRYGGEEFAAILPETGGEQGMEVAERLRLAIEKHDFAAATRRPVGTVTVSIGVASHPQHGESPEELISAADRALYAAKASGRNRTVLWEPTMTATI
jgi:diguanylate cyclase (GGDEF)-like protein